MKNPYSKWLLLAVLLLGAFLWLVYDWMQKAQSALSAEEIGIVEETPALLSKEDVEKPLAFSLEDFQLQLSERRKRWMISGQHVLHFAKTEDYQAFLHQQSLGNGDWNVLDQIDEIQFVLSRTRQDRVRLPKGCVVDLNYLTNRAVPAINVVQVTAVPFQHRLNDWLDLGRFPSRQGEGVRIGVIDAGAMAHPLLQPASQSFDFTKNKEHVNPHGTQVMSMISGISGKIEGIAQRAEVYDFRVSGREGLGSSFRLAKAIVAAAKHECDLVNLSLGSMVDCLVLREATRYANEQGALLIAAAGNFGSDLPIYPAAYPEVVCVGAHDAKGEVMGFSSYGDHVDILAPGFRLIACADNEKFRFFTGTSAAAPIFSAAVARVASDFEVDVETAASWILGYADDAGVSGRDVMYGVGTLNLSKVYFSDQKDWTDPAVSCAYFDPVTSEVVYKFENYGTQPVWNVQVQLSGPQGETPFSIPQILAGESFEHRVRVNASLVSEKPQTLIEADILGFRSSGYEELRAHNNALYTLNSRRGEQMIRYANGVNSEVE